MHRDRKVRKLAVSFAHWASTTGARELGWLPSTWNSSCHQQDMTRDRDEYVAAEAEVARDESPAPMFARAKH
jgi:hypothetical protein